eukprot:NODE_6698_length_825_cov_7.497151_g6462_i0.p1 GENE.NODE_6698_length_825_cov_7.497151_g6462_i0~~NODE_6698_length_825_cov_7.497151_g6462_i0.p1  ORF type:complete len:223 (-),score=21.49 NODE_6698_length_825_cov_7.497151_g6462_i0:100-768(-)
MSQASTPSRLSLSHRLEHTMMKHKHANNDREDSTSAGNKTSITHVYAHCGKERSGSVQRQSAEKTGSIPPSTVQFASRPPSTASEAPMVRLTKRQVTPTLPSIIPSRQTKRSDTPSDCGAKQRPTLADRSDVVGELTRTAKRVSEARRHQQELASLNNALAEEIDICDEYLLQTIHQRGGDPVFTGDGISWREYCTNLIQLRQAKLPASSRCIYMRLKSDAL